MTRNFDTKKKNTFFYSLSLFSPSSLSFHSPLSFSLARARRQGSRRIVWKRGITAFCYRCCMSWLCAVSVVLALHSLSLPLSLRLGQRRRGLDGRLRVHVRALEQLVEHLGQRRVAVDAELDVLHALSRRDRVGRLVDEVRGVQADDVHAQDLARVLVGWESRIFGERERERERERKGKEGEKK